LFVQIGVLPPQSELTQQVPVVHELLQHFWPVLHWASFVHWQFAVPHWFVTVLQHWLARQPAEDRHPATHLLFVQTGVLPPQSELTQQVPVVHELLQHF
jgi:hypothetical protein